MDCLRKNLPQNLILLKLRLDEFLSEWKEMKSKRVHGLISEEQYKQWENMFLQKE